MSFHCSCFIIPSCLDICSFIDILVCLSLVHSVYEQKKQKKTKKKQKNKKKTKTKQNKTKTKGRKKKEKRKNIYK